MPGQVSREPRGGTVAPGVSQAAGGFHDLIDGIRYVAGRRPLMALLSATAVWGLSGGVQVLIALFGQQIFPLGPGKGSLGISLLTVASGIGTAIGPIVAGADLRRMHRVIPAGYLVGGLFFLALGQSWSLASAGAALFIGRMGDSAVWSVGRCRHAKEPISAGS